ncbi:MAG: polysaccharide deacetylase family protein [Betaproteobacteria bacterium]
MRSLFILFLTSYFLFFNYESFAIAEEVTKIVNKDLAADLIRLHRFNHLQDKSEANQDALKDQCRYESEVSTAPPKGKVILSFDDGPNPQQTPYILDILAKHNVPGSFFLVGHRVKQHPNLVEKILATRTHVIGNHSWDHPNFHEITPEEQIDEVLKTKEVLPSPIGQLFFRYPYGNSTCDANKFIHQQGYKIVGWHIDSCDWAFDSHGFVDSKEALSCGVLPQNTHNFVNHVVSSIRAHNGGILLMHEIHPSTVRQLEEIVNQLKNSGFIFTTVEDSAFSPVMR